MAQMQTLASPGPFSIHPETEMCTLDPPCSSLLPPHPAPGVEELIHVIRQLHNGTYNGPSDIITTLTPSEYSAFETAIRTKNLLKFNRPRWCWLPTIRQLHIRMSESGLHGCFSNELRDIVKECTTATVQQLPQDSRAHDEFKRLNLKYGGRIGPEREDFTPDVSIGYASRGGNTWYLCVEVAKSQTWDHVQAKAKAYFERYIDKVAVVIIFNIAPDEPQSTSREAKYQIWRAPISDSSTSWEAEPSSVFVFRRRNGAVQNGALPLRLSDMCPGMPAGADVNIDIPHDRLVAALREAEEWDERSRQRL